MAEEDVNLLNYVVICISEFASRYQMHMRDAYIYEMPKREQAV